MAIHADKKGLENALKNYAVEYAVVPLEDGGGCKATFKELGLCVKGYGASQEEAKANLFEIALDTLIGEDIP